ncbi:MAG TPA: hypothetical protein VLG71_03190 [Candidatus Limnocylindria bacterium]|nr:hypothetical protein [Candidatus Limnocylindria bacterium]
MNIYTWLRAIQQWLVRFIQLQLFLSLVSLPILLLWGLPFSLLSPLGNLLFGPVITLFLLLSSLLFFSQLCMIPNGFLVTCLEKLTAGWLAIMYADNSTWLVGFVKPPLILLFILLLVTFAVLHYGYTRSHYLTIVLLCGVFISAGAYLKIVAAPTLNLFTIPCNKGSLTVLHDNKQLIVIDPGYMGQRTNAASWVQYTLMPELIRLTGSTTIDHLIILQPGAMLFGALERLCTVMGIKNVYLSVWHGDMSKAGLYRFFSCKRTLEAKGVKLIRLAQQPLTLPLSGHTSCTLTPLPTMVKTASITFYAHMVTAQIDKQKITLYPAKYVSEQ